MASGEDRAQQRRAAQSVKRTHSPFRGCCTGRHPSIVAHSSYGANESDFPLRESMNLEFLKVIEKAGSLATLIYVKLLRRSKVESLFFEHGLRANAFRACREGKSVPTPHQVRGRLFRISL
jgi:hypothetical protein